MNNNKLSDNQIKNVYTELTVDQLQVLLDNSYKKKPDMDIIIIKFSATWCQPCQKIKELCNELFNKTPDNVVCFDIDIDKNRDLYVALKSKKMIKGVPTLFRFNCKKDRDINHWYIPDASISGSNETDIMNFFKVNF